MYLDLLNSLGDDFYKFIGKIKKRLVEALNSRKEAGLYMLSRGLAHILVYKFPLYFGLSIYGHVSTKNGRCMSVSTWALLNPLTLGARAPIAE